jgi:hypothetical protein
MKKKTVINYTHTSIYISANNAIHGSFTNPEIEFPENI